MKKEIIPTAQDQTKKELYEQAMDRYIQDAVTLNKVEEYDFKELKSTLENLDLERQKGMIKQLDNYAENYRLLQYVMNGKSKSFSAQSYKELKTYCLK